MFSIKTLTMLLEHIMEKKNTIVGAVPKFNRKFVSKIDVPDRSLSGPVTPIKSKLASPLSESMWSCKCFSRVNSMPNLTYNQRTDLSSKRSNLEHYT